MFMMILIVYLYVKEEKYIKNVNDFHSFMQMWRNMPKMLVIFTWLYKRGESV